MIKGLQKTTLIDYPGKIACTIFIGGCNFRCGYYYNSDLVFKLNEIPSITEEQIFNFLETRKKFLEGVCITGGEPTLYPGLEIFIKKIKDLGFSVKLDTNGSNSEVLERLLKGHLLDYVAMDVKASLENYEWVIGTKVSREKLKGSIELIKKSGVDYEFRTTIIPDVIDSEQITAICQEIKGAKRYFLQQFRPDKKAIGEKYRKMKPLPISRLREFQDIARQAIPEVAIRNC